MSAVQRNSSVWVLSTLGYPTPPLAGHTSLCVPHSFRLVFHAKSTSFLTLPQISAALGLDSSFYEVSGKMCIGLLGVLMSKQLWTISALQRAKSERIAPP